MNFSVYSLTDPETNCICYVGKTVKLLEKRLKGHIGFSSKNTSRRVCRWIRNLSKKNLIPTIDLLESFSDKNDMDIAECFWIATIRASGADLLNMTDGGDGIPPGYKFSEEARKRMSEKSHFRNPINLGKKQSQETKDKRAAKHRGMKRSPACCKKISDSLKGKKLSAEHKRCISETKRGKKLSDETKKKISISTRNSIIRKNQL